MLPLRTNWLTVSLVVLSSFTLSRAQEEPAGAPNLAPDEVPTVRPPSEPPPEAAPAPPPAPYRPLGPQLFPFYEHYVRGEDETRVRHVLYVFQKTEGKDGSSSHLLLPFFYHEQQVDPPESHLHLYPLLYFHKSSEAESYNYAFPLVYDHRTPETSTQLVLPLWLHRATEGRKFSRHHVLFPFFRHTADLREPGRPLKSVRVGLWKILELWEARSGPDTYDRKALTFFNWSDDALSGLSVYASSWVGKGDSLRGTTTLFPLYRRSRSPGSQTRVLFPLYWQGDSPSGSHLWVVPFFGHWQSEDSQSLWILPLLSGFGKGPGESKSFATLPLFMYETGPEHFGLGTLLGGYWRTRESSVLNVLLLAYHSRHEFESGKRTHSVLFPLSHFDVEPDGVNGTRWAFPYVETFDDDSLWRIVAPLYLEYQTRVGGEMDWYIKTGFPLYWSWGEPDDHFSMGFPLYWASRSGPRGWRLFIPLFAQSYNATSSGTHVPLVFSYRSFPSRKQFALGGPLYVHEREYDIDDQLSGQSHSLLWPFVKAGWGNDGYDFRLLPLFWISRDGETRDLLLGPFYRQTGPDGTRHHFFPLYGRYDSDGLTRDYYGAGSFISSLYRDENGEPASQQHDYLWKLASFQKSLKTDASHQHVLPLGFWRTQSEQHDRTVAGPLYYSHRIREKEREYNLRLFLGNLFLSKTTTERIPAPVVPPADLASDAEPDATVATDPSATTDASDRTPEVAATGNLHPLDSTPLDPTEGPTAERRVVGRDTGILWPLSRSFYSADDETTGSWVLPFYFDRQDRFRSHRAYWPLLFAQQDKTGYHPSYFRYFFLYDHENWEGGYRRTFGQLLFDWKHDEKRNTRRWRFLYPFLEHEQSDSGYQFAFMKPIFSLGSATAHGERITHQHLFPFYWQGARDRENADGGWTPLERHFFFLPLFGVHSRTTRTDYYTLFPLFHLLHSKEATNFELWPLLFSRNEPGLQSLRLWPLHSNERGEFAGDFWVSRFLFLSKYFSSPDETEFSLDPFLFQYKQTPTERRSNALFHLYVNNRGENDAWFHLFPLVFSGAEGKTSFTSMFPLFYGRNSGDQPIDYLSPWRFFSVVNRLTQEDGERHTNVLWKLFEYTNSASEEEFHELRVLHALLMDRKTPTSRQFAFNPFFSYYRDDTADETQLSFLLSLYSYRKVKGEPQHTFLYFLRF